MGDDAHQPVPFRQAGQCPHSLLQGFLIQGAKALVHEHGVQPDASGGGLNFIGESQGQGQRRLEGLAAGEGVDTALRAVVVVDDIQLQAALAAVVLCLNTPLQLVLSAGHHHEPGVGPGDDAVKIGHLDIGLQHDLLLAADVAVGGVRQRPDPGPLLLRLLQVPALLFQVFQGRLVAADAGRQLCQALAELGYLDGQRLSFCPLQFQVDGLRLSELLLIALYLAPEGIGGSFPHLVRFLRLFQRFLQRGAGRFQCLHLPLR